MSQSTDEFLRAIAAQPDDPEPYLVFADWLLGHDDPRGELISVQHALATEGDTPRRLELLHREAELLARTAFWPEVPTSMRNPAFFGDGRSPPCSDVDWFCGYARTVWVQTSEAHAWPRNTCDGPAFLRFVLRHPSARFVRALRIDAVVGDSSADIDVAPLVDVVLSEAPASLRVLDAGRLYSTHVGEEDERATRIHAARIGNVRWLSKLTSLESAALTGRGASFEGLTHHELQHLSLRILDMTPARLLELYEADLPCLESLTLWLGNGVGPEDLEPLLSGSVFPELKYLGLQNAGRADALCRVLPDSGLLPRLKTLDLSMGTLDAGGLVHLKNRARELVHLKELNLDANYLADQRPELWSGLAGHVSARFQDETEPKRVLVPDRLERVSFWPYARLPVRNQTMDPFADETLTGEQLEHRAQWALHHAKLAEDRWAQLHALTHLAQWAAEQGKVRVGIDALRQLLRVARVTDTLAPRRARLITLGELLLDAGETWEAQYHLECALEMLTESRSGSDPGTRAYVQASLALVAIARGELETARARIAEARQADRRTSGRGPHSVPGRHYTEVVTALIDWTTGDLDRAWRTLEGVKPSLPRKHRPSDIDYTTRYLLGHRVDAWIAALRSQLGDRKKPAAALARTTQLLRDAGDARGLFQADVCRGFVLVGAPGRRPEQQSHARAVIAARTGSKSASVEARILAGLLERRLSGD